MTLVAHLPARVARTPNLAAAAVALAAGLAGAAAAAQMPPDAA